MSSEIELYLNGQLVDLSESSIIAITKQVNNIADLQTSYGDLTNEFELPFTQRNQEILGVSNQVQSGTTLPYTKIPVKLVDRGVEVMPIGYAIVRVAEYSYRVAIYQNNSDVFGKLSGRKLRELDYSDLSHDWNLPNIAASRSNTDGFKYSLIDYGRMSPSGDEVNSEELFPSFFTSTLIERIISGIGWSLDGAILSDAFYNKLKIDFSNDAWERPESEMDLYRSLTQANGVQTYNYIRGSEGSIPALRYPFPITLLDNGAVSNDLYNVLHNIRSNFNINIVMDYAFAGNATGDFGEVRLVIYNVTQDVAIQAWNIFAFSGSTIADDPTGEYGAGSNPPAVTPFIFQDGLLPFPNAFLEEGDQVEFRIDVVAEFDLDVNVTVFELSIEPNKQIGNDEYYLLQNQLPDMTQIDLLNAIMNICGIVPDGKSFNNVLKFRSFNELITNDAVDMSDKYIENKDPIEFHPSSYAQKNNFTWDNDDITTEDLGKSFFSIPDESLDVESDIVNLPFGASDMVRRLNGLNVPLIKKVSYGEGFDLPNGEYDGLPTPPPFVPTTIHVDELLMEPSSIRLSIDDTQDLDHNIIYSDQTGSIAFANNVPLCHFFLESEEFNLDWGSLLELNYPVLIQIMQKYKKTFPNFTLKAPDIQNFDHFIPWYLNKYSAKFWPMRINNYKNGFETTVELVKI